MKVLPVINQYWRGDGLVLIRQQAINWTTDDQDL